MVVDIVVGCMVDDSCCIGYGMEACRFEMLQPVQQCSGNS